MQRLYLGDQGQPATLLAAEKAAGPFDVIIDDGSHRSDHMIATFRALFPKLRAGGIYFIEDLEANFLQNTGPIENIQNRSTMPEFLGNLIMDMSYPWFAAVSAFQRGTHRQDSNAVWVDSVQCWRYLCAVQKRREMFRPSIGFISRKFGAKPVKGKKGAKMHDKRMQVARGSRWPCSRVCAERGKHEGLCWCH